MTSEFAEEMLTDFERVFVSPRLRRFQRDEWYVFFDPTNFKWTKVNESGRFIIEKLQQYYTVNQVAQAVADQFPISFADADTAVRQFIDGLVEKGFLCREEYRTEDVTLVPDPEFPNMIYIHMTNACNLACTYCYNREERTTKIRMAKKGLVDPVMNTKEMKTLIKRIIDLGGRHLLFTGGEPLLRKDAIEIFQYTRDCNDTIRMELLTNGTRFTVENIEIIVRCFDAVTISLDGHNQELHERFRGPKTFQPMVDGVKLLVDTKKKLGKKLNICMVPVWTKENIGTMLDVFRFCREELEADSLAPILFQAGDHQELSISQIPQIDEFEDAMQEVRDYFEAKEARGEIKADKRPMPVYPRNNCGVGNGEISIDPGGEVYPCQSLHYDEFKSGNVRETDILEIFRKSAVLNGVRSARVETSKVCKHCDFRYLCNGGCRATSYNIYRAFESHNEVYCRYLEGFALNKLWGSSCVPLTSK